MPDKLEPPKNKRAPIRPCCRRCVWYGDGEDKDGYGVVSSFWYCERENPQNIENVYYHDDAPGLSWEMVCDLYEHNKVLY